MTRLPSMMLGGSNRHLSLANIEDVAAPAAAEAAQPTPATTHALAGDEDVATYQQQRRREPQQLLEPFNLLHIRDGYLRANTVMGTCNPTPRVGIKPEGIVELGRQHSLRFLT